MRWTRQRVIIGACAAIAAAGLAVALVIVLARGLTMRDLSRDLLPYTPRLDGARLRLMTGHRGHVQ